MSNWCGGLPPEPKKKEDDKKRIKKGGKPGSPSDHGGRPKVFFGGAVPATPPKDLPKLTAADLKGPPVIFKVAPASKLEGNPPPSPKAPPLSPTAPPSSPKALVASSAPSPPPPPPPSPSTPAERDPTPQYSSPSPPSLPSIALPSVFDKKKKKKKKKRKKKPPPPPQLPSPCYDACEEEAEEKRGEAATLPSIFAISHIPATRQYEDDNYQEIEDRSGQASPRSGEEDDGPDIPPSVPRYLRGNVFAGIFGKQIDARNITEVGLHGWHATSNAPYDATDDGDTVTVGPSGWHQARESPW